LSEGKASNVLCHTGNLIGLPDGIPYMAKNSYKAKGKAVVAGSPAFANLIASEGVFAIAQLCKSSVILIGLTNMPPMANSGMQPGLYGRGLVTV
jgi:amidase